MSGQTSTNTLSSRQLYVCGMHYQHRWSSLGHSPPSKQAYILRPLSHVTWPCHQCVILDHRGLHFTGRWRWRALENVNCTEECPDMNVGTGKFSDDVEMTVEYMRWRCTQGASSRWRKRQPEKLGCRQWRVWPMARRGDWWRLKGGQRSLRSQWRHTSVPTDTLAAVTPTYLGCTQCLRLSSSCRNAVELPPNRVVTTALHTRPVCTVIARWQNFVMHAWSRYKRSMCIDSKPFNCFAFSFLTNLFPVTEAQNLSKSVKICQSYWQKSTACHVFTEHHVQTIIIPTDTHERIKKQTWSAVLYASSRNKWLHYSHCDYQCLGVPTVR